MGVASLVLGIISLVFSFVPIVGIFVIGLAILGLIFGIIDWVQKKKASEKYGKAIAGVVCASLAIVLVIIINVLFGALIFHFAKNADENKIHDFINRIEEYDYNDFEDYDEDDFEFPFDFDIEIPTKDSVKL